MDMEQYRRLFAMLDEMEERMASERAIAPDLKLTHLNKAREDMAEAAAELERMALRNTDWGRIKNDPAPEHPNITQVGGDHYLKLRIQPWDAMEAWMSPEAFKGFLLGNVIKYVARGKWDRYEDLKKAQHYLEKLLQTMGEESKNA